MYQGALTELPVADAAPFDHNTDFFRYLLPLGFVLDATEANPLLILVVAGILVFFHQVFVRRLCLYQGSVTSQFSRQLAPLPRSVDESGIRDLA